MLRRTLAVTLAAVLTTALTLLVTATPALAHAKLESTVPATGASLAAPPTTVSLTFGEPVTVGANPISVTGPGGVSWTVGKVSVTDSTVSAPVTATGPAGTYMLAYTVISDDGDDVSGKIPFTLTAAATPTAPTTTAAPTTTVPPATTAAAPAPAAASTPTGSGGVPAWVWVVVAVVVLGGIGAVVARSRRARS